jgi:hypothetical protein
MPLNFAFAPSQQQTFELRCDYGSRRLDKTELGKLIDLCEQNYYPKEKDSLPDFKQLGWRLYQWLDANEGWLRRALNEADEQTIYLDLIQTSEAQGIGRTKVSRAVECVSSACDGGYCQGYFFDFSP